MQRFNALSGKGKVGVGCLALIVLSVVCSICSTMLTAVGLVDPPATPVPAGPTQSVDDASATLGSFFTAPTVDPSAPGPTIAPYDTEVPPEVAPGVGTGVAVGDTQAWVVGAVEDKGQEIQSGNQFIPNPKTSGRFLLVSVGVRNNGTDAFFIDTPKVVDNAGREFDSHTDASIYLIDDDHKCILEKLNPGLDKGCAWIYEVPADATGLKLKVSPGMFSEPVLFDLGQ